MKDCKYFRTGLTLQLAYSYEKIIEKAIYKHQQMALLFYNFRSPYLPELLLLVVDEEELPDLVLLLLEPDELLVVEDPEFTFDEDRVELELLLDEELLFVLVEELLPEPESKRVVEEPEPLPELGRVVDDPELLPVLGRVVDEPEPLPELGRPLELLLLRSTSPPV